jgi:hypothetical protein
VENKELKINVINKDGSEVKVLTGKNFNILSDMTRRTFSTECIKSFVSFSRPLVEQGALVCFNDSSAVCHDSDFDYSTKEFAVLKLTETEMLKKLRLINHRSLTPVEADDFITSLRGYSSDISKLFSLVRSTKIKAVIEAERTIDTMGNYIFSVTRKGATREELNMPETVTFQVPAFELIDDVVQLEFEVGFNFKETGDTAAPIKIEWALHCYEIDELIKKAERTIVENAFSVLPQESVLYGEIKLFKQTSDWSIKESSGS